jgi:hypothetical protein
MKTLLRWLGTLSLLAVVGAPTAAPACPMCKDAVSVQTNATDPDPAQEARAWNYNIYAFVSIPYVLVGMVGFMVYRSFKKHSRQTGRPGAGAAPAAEGQGHADADEPPAALD